MGPSVPQVVELAPGSLTQVLIGPVARGGMMVSVGHLQDMKVVVEWANPWVGPENGTGGRGRLSFAVSLTADHTLFLQYPPGTSL